MKLRECICQQASVSQILSSYASRHVSAYASWQVFRKFCLHIPAGKCSTNSVRICQQTSVTNSECICQQTSECICQHESVSQILSAYACQQASVAQILSAFDNMQVFHKFWVHMPAGKCFTNSTVNIRKNQYAYLNSARPKCTWLSSYTNLQCMWGMLNVLTHSFNVYIKQQHFNCFRSNA